MLLTEHLKQLKHMAMKFSKQQLYELHGVLSPRDLATLAGSQEVDVPDIDVADYYETIRILRDEKGYSFAKIVAFLAEHGLSTNRTAVFRVYKAGPINDQEEPLIDDETGERVE